MSDKHSEDYHAKASDDISTKGNLKIWSYFIILGGLLFIMIIGLTIFFRFQMSYLYDEKVGNVRLKEAVLDDTKSARLLSGSEGLFPDKKHIPIFEAMKIVVKNARKDVE